MTATGRPPDRDPAASQGEFRRVLGHLPTGVTVITATADGRLLGMAANSFTSVSLDPPLILFCPANSSTTWPEIQPTGRCCVNVLAGHHEELSRQFSRKGIDRFAGVDYTESDCGPRLADAVAWIDCVFGDEHEAGDHTIVVSRVIGLEASEDASPLVFHRGGYGTFAGSPEGSGGRSHRRAAERSGPARLPDALERCPSGLRSAIGNRVGGVNSPRGFESHPLRFLRSGGAWRRPRSLGSGHARTVRSPRLASLRPCQAGPDRRKPQRLIGGRRRSCAGGSTSSTARMPGITVGTVVQGGLGEDVEDAAGGACLRVGGGEDDGRDAGEDDRPRAHRARLQGHVEGRVGEAPAAEALGRGADREDLGVGGRVAASARARCPQRPGTHSPRRRAAPIGTSPCSSARRASARARSIPRSRARGPICSGKLQARGVHGIEEYPAWNFDATESVRNRTGNGLDVDQDHPGRGAHAGAACGDARRRARPRRGQRPGGSARRRTRSAPTRDGRALRPAPPGRQVRGRSPRAHGRAARGEALDRRAVPTASGPAVVPPGRCPRRGPARRRASPQAAQRERRAG